MKQALPKIIQRTIVLAVLMIGLVVAVGGITLVTVYQAAYRDESERLYEIARYQARLLETMIQQTEIQQPGLDRDKALTIALGLLQGTQNNVGNLSQKSEFVLGRKQDNTIILLLYKGLQGPSKPIVLDMPSPLASPMQRALAGKSGVMTGVDYRGIEVMAAYVPLLDLELGIVAKINLSDFERSYIKAGVIAAFSGLVLISIAILIFYRVSGRIIHQAREHEVRLDVILDTVVDGIISIDTKGIITSYNKAAQRLFGYTAEEAIGKSINMLIPEDYHAQHDNHLADYMKTHTSKIMGVSREVVGKRRDGSIFPMDLAISNAEVGGQMVFTGIVRDISQRKQVEAELEQHREHLEEQVKQRTLALEKANKQLEKLARRDSLTGIANRRVFDSILKLEMSRAARNRTPLTLIISDIDFFKNYNDGYGHPAGDACLIKIAKQIESNFLRAGDVVARYGGEEFAVILPNTNRDEAEHLIKLLLDAIRQLKITHEFSPAAHYVTLSAGVATMIPGNNVSDGVLLKAADDALYQAKQSGRDRYVFSDIPKDQHKASA